MTESVHADATYRTVRTARPRAADAAVDRAALQEAIDILADWFPVVRVLLWDDPFKTAAEAFFSCRSTTALSHSSTLKQFPSYLRAYGSSSSIEYLADIADLECAHRVAQHVFRRRSVSADLLSALASHRSQTTCVELHPSVSLLQSRFPIVSIWEGIRANRFTLQRWTSELALIAKPAAAVRVLRVSVDQYLLLTALARGSTIADAIGSARVVNAGFDADCALTFLAELNIVAGLRDLTEPTHSRPDLLIAPQQH